MTNAPWRQMGGEERLRVLLGDWRSWVPAASVLLASLLALLPLFASAARMPDVGFLMLLAWRLYRPDLMPSWAGLPLGLFADFAAANPPGVAATLWPAALLLVGLLERRLPLGDYGSDWAAVALFAPVYILLARLLAAVAHPVNSLAPIVPQAAAMVLLFPLVGRLCATIEQRWMHRR